MQIKTVPADTDAAATKLARYLATQLQQVGIDATVVPMSREELSRSVLLNHEFELYVYRLPFQRDPDFLRPLLHSRYAADNGWQNPFGADNQSLDDLLDRQRTEHGATRTSTIRDAQNQLVEDQSFTPIAVPNAPWASRPNRVTWPDGVPHHSVTAYLAAQPVDTESTSTGSSGSGSTATPSSTDNSSTTESTTTSSPTATPTSESKSRLRMALTDARPTKNLNPLSPSFRADRTVLRLVYDSLGRAHDGTVQPWMAESWSWHDGDSTTLSLDLREGVEWHDGTKISAADVAFTFEFLSDTGLGSLDKPVPSPRYRGRASLIDDITTHSSHELTFEFGDVDEAVAERALTVPILPKHVWKEFARPTNGTRLEGRNLTEAIVRKNLDPVGSGPLRVTETSPKESLTMEPFESHFLSREGLDESLAAFEGGFSFDVLEFTVYPSDGAVVELLADGTVDASANPLSAGPATEARENSELTVETGRSQWCYHIGYNHRSSPFGDPRFRRAVARLMDRSFLVDQLFDGEATAVVSPLGTTAYTPEGEEWHDTLDELRFVSYSGTGSIDTERAKSMFEDAGYSYSADGDLLVEK